MLRLGVYSSSKKQQIKITLSTQFRDEVYVQVDLYDQSPVVQFQ